ncbi:MAG: hypothetical protein EA376_12065 [Phycisphaeraceae bacterium]|nr:MAG: hypothetical protein EA376_12065 [Phycisphaeraceae bacterium]
MMSPLRSITVFMLFAVMFATCAARAQDVPDLESRLGALAPENPLAYFELAEEVAYESDTPEGLDLARRLFALAFELDRRAHDRADAGPLGASVCLALADLSTSSSERRWLHALAGTMERRDEPVDWSVLAPRGPTREASFQVSEAMGLYRAGEYRRARNILDNPEATETLHRYRALIQNEIVGITHRTQVETACRECRNRRIVRSQHDSAGAQRLCYTCGGNPGPQLTDEQIVEHLRFESILLSGVQRSWAAQIVVDRGAPLRDLDPDELAPLMNADPDRPYWRQGAWVAQPDSMREQSPHDN